MDEVNDDTISNYAAETIATLEDIEVDTSDVSALEPQEFVDLKTLADNLVVRALAIQAYFTDKISGSEFEENSDAEESR